MITSVILSYIWPIVIPAMVVGAVAARMFVPVAGKLLFVSLLCGAAAYSAYELGYSDRGRLDKSAELQAQLEIANANLSLAQKEAAANKIIGDEAAAREAAAVQSASDLQAKVTDYEKTLDQKAANTCPSGCKLSADDVIGLRAIRRARRAGRPAHAP